ncbi:DUF1450 domain-containing protein [Priestia megaterium]|uniref:DUF1450 domain-containing protein n=1 Tax=Priestia megaterium TaxID=1404 RepID=UPI0013E35E3B|nr:DUF1450 domain-containing protein [Priestia megaterium]MDI3090192.1 DUF1450 domain-containing protein [Priestia megaterium]MED3866731.1 DUF1450 domain-containing protein [Priestia megaterium]MED4100969.1 DUF1450 domain-containing protein [Priestia megaterium]MED4146266.1 DUF1450 domain-containing protein [Priestia megaterium]MED4169769.1 DUF1450 domain-containing protein [Priestia megaterium]
MEYTVKFCPCNFEEELYDVKEKLQQISNVEIIEEKCLLYCGQCLIQPFALVNGKNIVSDSVSDLLADILQHLEGTKINCSKTNLQANCGGCGSCSYNKKQVLR